MRDADEWHRELAVPDVLSRSQTIGKSSPTRAFARRAAGSFVLSSRETERVNRVSRRSSRTGLKRRGGRSEGRGADLKVGTTLRRRRTSCRRCKSSGDLRVIARLRCDRHRVGLVPTCVVLAT